MNGRSTTMKNDPIRHSAIRHPMRSPSTCSPQPTATLRQLEAPRSSRLLNLRQSAYQPKGLRFQLDEHSVAGQTLSGVSDIIGVSFLFRSDASRSFDFPWFCFTPIFSGCQRARPCRRKSSGPRIGRPRRQHWSDCTAGFPAVAAPTKAGRSNRALRGSADRAGRQV